MNGARAHINAHTHADKTHGKTAQRDWSESDRLERGSLPGGGFGGRFTVLPLLPAMYYVGGDLVESGCAPDRRKTTGGVPSRTRPPSPTRRRSNAGGRGNEWVILRVIHKNAYVWYLEVLVFTTLHVHTEREISAIFFHVEKIIWKKKTCTGRWESWRAEKETTFLDTKIRQKKQNISWCNNVKPMDYINNQFDNVPVLHHSTPIGHITDLGQLPKPIGRFGNLRVGLQQPTPKRNTNG